MQDTYTQHDVLHPKKQEQEQEQQQQQQQQEEEEEEDEGDPPGWLQVMPHRACSYLHVDG
jgi:hypothetical protein